MRTFLAFLGLIGAGLLAIALLTYPAWLLVTPALDVPFHRVGSRIGMLALLIGFLLLARRLRLNDKRSLGYALPRPAFMRELAIGLGLGVATMLLPVATMLLLDLRELKPGLSLEAADIAGLALEGLLRGLAVSLIEETFIRGAMFSGIARESGARVAIVLTALLYSAFHFIGRARIPADELGWTSGFDMLGRSLQAFANFGAIADAFICLMGVGILLGLVRRRTGNIAACIGLHTGWVWVITFVRETSGRDETSGLAFLLSRFDGVVGWLVTAWIVVIGIGLSRFYARRSVGRTAN